MSNNGWSPESSRELNGPLEYSGAAYLALAAPGAPGALEYSGEPPGFADVT